MNLPGERIHDVQLTDEMKSSYLDYSMSVIVARALPDVRDGLKPVHRRILFGMQELGVTAGKPFKKSARIVGDVMGKYHPHGDSAIYDTVVRMAQNFSLRYPLVDGQGNFGSIDGDGAAAMRYTEARLQKIATEMLEDIDKETCDFAPNYDESMEEPTVLPAKLPNLLVNGVGGIAVGMATNIPPHNLNEVIDGVGYLIDNPDCEIDDLIFKASSEAVDEEENKPRALAIAPDFPTGGIIYGTQGILDGYRTGRGKVIIRARALIETDRRDRAKIVVTETPYQVNKAALAMKIAKLVNDKKLEGISDIRDESDRDGTRLVIELKKDAFPNVVLNQLYKHTQLQTTFGINMIALDNGVPKLMNIKTIMQKFIDHRHEIVLRRTRYELRKAKERAHILEGLKIAIDNIDRIIAIIRGSSGTETAKAALKEEFSLSDIQAKAILDMRLAKLTGLERQKLIEELKALRELIAELEHILDSREERMNIIKNELLELKTTFGDNRRTEVIGQYEEFSVEDMIAEEEMVVTISHTGYIKRQPLTSYRRQHRGGRGRTGATTKDEDFIEHLFIASTHDYVLFLTSKGHLHWLKVYDIPQLGRLSKGKAIVNLLQLTADEKMAAFVNVKEFDEDRYLILCSRFGTIKKTSLALFSNPRRGGIRAMNIVEGDELIGADITDGNCEVILGTSAGKAVRFREDQVRPMGRTAAGVRGVNLGGDQFVVGMVVVKRNGTLLVATDKGYGKRSNIEDYRLTKRGAGGVITLKTSPKVGKMIAIMEVVEDDDIMIITHNGIMIRLPAKAVRVIGRATQGVILNRLDSGDTITSIARVPKTETEDGENGEDKTDGDDTGEETSEESPKE